MPPPYPFERAYMARLKERGLSSEQILRRLDNQGWNERYARDLLEQSDSGQGHPSRPEPPSAGGASHVDAGGRVVRLLMRTMAPPTYLFGDFLTQGECEQVIALCDGRLDRSRVFGEGDDTTPRGSVSRLRTSRQAGFRRGDHALIDQILHRAAALVQWPVEQMEGLQALEYGPGAEFAPHHDYFVPDAHGTLRRPWQRVGSLLIYLSTPELGGATFFPDAGIEFAPWQGNALLFTYTGSERERALSLHAGAPVGRGRKWLATIFLTDRPTSTRDRERP